MPCPFDRLCDLPLVLCGGTGDAAGKQLTLFVDELEQEVCILVIDVLDTALLEAAIFLSLCIDRDRGQILDLALLLCCHALNVFGRLLFFYFLCGFRFCTLLLAVSEHVLVEHHR